MAEAQPANVIILKSKSDEEFNKLIKDNKIVIADFNATWCPPCRKLKPVLHAIAKKNPEIVVLDIDVQENSELAQKFKIQSIPAVYVYSDGKEVKNCLGFDEGFFAKEMPKIFPEYKK